MESINVIVTLATITPDNHHKVHSYIQRVNGYPIFNEYNKRIGKVKAVYVEKDSIKCVLEISIKNTDKTQITGIVSKVMQSMPMIFKL